MVLLDGIKLIDDYVTWYKNNTIVNTFDDYTQMVTPFVNHLNDRVQLYLESIPGNQIRISDDGETLRELELAGLDLNTPTRKRLQKGILTQFGTKINDDILYIDCDVKDFPKSKHKLIETIMRVYDLLNTQKSTVVSLFTEEVQDYFFENDFGGTPNVKLTGQSSIDYQVDYVIGARKSHPEIWIQLLNHLSFDSFSRVNTIYEDISLGRSFDRDTKKVIIFNDLEQRVSKKTELIASNKNILLFPWSNKSQVKEKILG